MIIVDPINPGIELSVLAQAAREVANWKLTLSQVVETMPRRAVEELFTILPEWSKHYPRAGTWVENSYNVPSLFVRADCTLDAKGALKVYEIDDRPCGIGVARGLNPWFAERFDYLRSLWPKFAWVAAADRPGDDALWLGDALPLEEARRYDGPLLIRGRPDNDAHLPLESRAIAPVSMEGDKNYGIKLGWWHLVATEFDFEEGRRVLRAPYPAEPCILKPLRGTRARCVGVHAGPKAREALRKRGIVCHRDDWWNEGVIIRAAHKEQMVWQPLHDPMQFAHAPGRNGIYRMYAGYNPHERSWNLLGGFWMARNAIIVHGTDDAVTGPLVCE